ncbi:YitT family protein [Romboutsia sp. 1001216sp1]|uniref:YitT family protein n=1 Tax=Romboutsia TaxID=1501226 RepID=UPI000A43E33F|nr:MULTISPECIES: YitT family protein [Romboutsia]MDB8791778.1 YitT family protein [Romboutsia sp. 1001216sp1]MDB8794099.1 YitT family protein [Romboutsia sp. 1001216sp1]MDB8796355.1 YitT family protein [Romboutsia sp. 1001216sp1]MDB8797892.1 YitT family protein [Romboutsia sp. 1001216sp1]MDB8801377.1 YitT family protein [Romboutsia sp. 1001216sp1]
MKKENSKLLVEAFGLILGCISMSIGINMFLKPHTIAPGGLSGLSVVLSKVTGMSVSFIMLAIGVPLVIFSFKILGGKNSIKTLIGTVMFSIIVNLMAPISDLIVTNDLLLSAISGAILLGIGIGIMFRADASTGGTDLIALILSKRFKGIKPTQFMVCLDAFVVISSGIASKNIEIALYSAIALYTMVKVADAIMEGFDYSKAFLIISKEAESLKEVITNDLSRGVTILNGRGGYTDDKKEVLLVVVPRNQEVHLKRLVKLKDPNAFIIVSNVHEVLGEGFKVLES